MQVRNMDIDSAMGHSSKSVSRTILETIKVLPYWPEDEGPHESVLRGVLQMPQTCEREPMYETNVDDHGPVQVSLFVMIGDESWKGLPHGW